MGPEALEELKALLYRTQLSLLRTIVGNGGIEPKEALALIRASLDQLEAEAKEHGEL